MKLSSFLNAFKSKTSDQYRTYQQPTVECAPHALTSPHYAYHTQPYPQSQVYTPHQTMPLQVTPFIYHCQTQQITQPPQFNLVCSRMAQNQFRTDIPEAALVHPPIQNPSHQVYQNGNIAHQFQQQNPPSHNQHEQHHHQQQHTQHLAQPLPQPQQLPPQQHIVHQQPLIQHHHQQQQQYQNHQMLTTAQELPLEAQCLMYESSSKELRALSGIIRRDIDKLKRELEAIRVDLPDYDVIEAKI